MRLKIRKRIKYLLLTAIAAVVLMGCATIQSPEPLSVKAPAISIRQAAWDGNIKAVKQHLAAGVDVDEKDLYGETSLHYAADKGHKEIVELLIANGADVNAKLIYGTTPLDSTDKKQIRDLLREHGAKTGDELEAEDK
ncbi:ankyrin repeat domain-containing protein [Verrucomicrobia bacterium]|nr:ankyrin repeat domain-containing protein [Verrucomicrobiota bacterium]